MGYNELFFHLTKRNMSNDPELKAMSAVYDALSGLNEDTRKRVVVWVLAKLNSPSSGGTIATGAKRGPKPGKKRGRKRGPKAAATGAKRGPKPGKKRERKPGRPPKNAASAVKKAGRRGRPAGTGKKSAGRGRGRPRKAEGSQTATS